MPGAIEAIRAWESCVGPEHVSQDSNVLDRYSRSTSGLVNRPICVVYPSSREEVQSIVQTAARHHMPLYPISRGNNWGYGDATAPRAGSTIVDLRRMNRILEVNQELAYCVVEPGVTQGQLYAYLTEQNTGLWMDATGAGMNASLIGNLVERGFGHTRYADHFATTCGMEVVLPDGEILDTGFGHYAQAQTSRLYRYGIGPSLDGLFCQSNFGIVTKMGLWLMPKPEAFSFFYITVEEDHSLGELVDKLRPLRMTGLLPTALHIANDLRLLSAAGPYPWEASGGKAPLPPELRHKMRHRLGAGAWTAGGSIEGPPGHVRAIQKKLREAVKGTGRIHFVGDRKLKWGARIARLIGWTQPGKRLQEKLDLLAPNYGLLKGIPTDEPLRGTHWRLRANANPEALDPLDSGAGVIWLSPVVPMTGRDAHRLVQLTEPIFAKYAFDPLFTFTLVNERAMVAILNATFDAREAKESENARAWYLEATEILLKEGYIPYRASPLSMPLLRDPEDTFWKTALRIKRALDPNDIIAPGRYLPPLDEWETALMATGKADTTTV